VSVESLATVKVPADRTPLENRTEDVPHRCRPVIVTVLPTAPLVGETASPDGAVFGRTWKLAALVVFPDGASTAIVPVAAPAGTAVAIVTSDVTLNTAAVPPNLTAVAFPPVMKPEPEIVTLVPT
jgi:hypothetical protein